MTTNDVLVFFAAIGFVASIMWTGTGIGMAARFLVQLHADRVAERLSERRDR